MCVRTFAYSQYLKVLPQKNIIFKNCSLLKVALSFLEHRDSDSTLSVILLPCAKTYIFGGQISTKLMFHSIWRDKQRYPEIQVTIFNNRYTDYYTQVDSGYVYCYLTICRRSEWRLHWSIFPNEWTPVWTCVFLSQHRYVFILINLRSF